MPTPTSLAIQTPNASQYVIGRDTLSTSPLQYVSPSNFFYYPNLPDLGSTVQDSAVQIISSTYMNDSFYEYMEARICFNLLGALLDTAPTSNSQTSPVLFTIYIKTSDTADSKQPYIIDAMIQTLGETAMSPTYITTPTLLNKSTYVAFPVTNFFSVAKPGAPYTLVFRIMKQTYGFDKYIPQTGSTSTKAVKITTNDVGYKGTKKDILYVSPRYTLYSSDTTGGPPVVTPLAGIYMTSVSAPIPTDNVTQYTYFPFVEAVFTFELEGPLLTSAPTESPIDPSDKDTTSEPRDNLFVVFVNIGTFVLETPASTVFPYDYILEARIQSKGLSASSTTYVTRPTILLGYPSNYYISFPVTNFFNVSDPGAPYTLYITASVIEPPATA